MFYIKDEGENMESLVVLSKVKKFIKEKADFNTSAGFFEPLNEDIMKSCKDAIVHAQKLGRKTVMGKDFSLFKENPQIEDSLVVASKVKKLIKDEAGLSTSSQAIDQLTLRVQTICLRAIEKAKEDKRKTVMDRDFESPMVLTSM
jgi:histone H3/H4